MDFDHLRFLKGGLDFHKASQSVYISNKIVYDKKKKHKNHKDFKEYTDLKL